MKHADKRTITKLRNGTITISTAYSILTTEKPFSKKKYISKNSEFKCQSCDKIHRMGEMERVKLNMIKKH